ncbi:MAG: ABC transporter permease [Spirochaetes bacterium]|nr:ABC transporter permease [Spirochaetota bacterium]
MNRKLPLGDKVLDAFVESRAAVSVLVVALGFACGTVLVLAVGRNPAGMYAGILQTLSGWDLTRGTWNARYIGEWIATSMPLVLCGLSMAFAARTGLFNIGAEGQYIAGLTAAQFVALLGPGIPGLHWALALAAAVAAGAAWGAIAGALKARFEVSEVVATIMLNYVAFFLSRWMTGLIPGANTYRTPDFPLTARLDDAFLRSITNGSRLNIGLWFTIGSVLVFWLLMERTRAGFALRATGFNREAARAAGISVRSATAASMAVSGAFAGLAGAVVALGSFSYGRVLGGLDNYGFDGIAVALVGGSTAFGTAAAGLLFGMLSSARPLMQSRGIPKEIALIISGLVVVFVSLRAAFKAAGDLMAARTAAAAASTGSENPEIEGGAA